MNLLKRFQGRIQIFIPLSNYLSIIEGSASKTQCICGKGKKSREPETYGENQNKIVEGYEPWHRPWMTFIQVKKR